MLVPFMHSREFPMSWDFLPANRFLAFSSCLFIWMSWPYPQDQMTGHPLLMACSLRAYSIMRVEYGMVYGKARINGKDFYEYRWITPGPERLTTLSRLYPQNTVEQKRS